MQLILHISWNKFAVNFKRQASDVYPMCYEATRTKYSEIRNTVFRKTVFMVLSRYGIDLSNFNYTKTSDNGANMLAMSR